MKKDRARLLSIASGAICVGVLVVGAVRYREFGGLYYLHELQSDPGLLLSYAAAADASCQARGAELYLRSAVGRQLVRRALVTEVLRLPRFRRSFEKSTAALVALCGNRLLFRFRSEDGIHGGGSWSLGRGGTPSMILALSPRMSSLFGLVFRVDDPCASVRVLPADDAFCRFDECSKSPFSNWQGEFCLYIERE